LAYIRIKMTSLSPRTLGRTFLAVVPVVVKSIAAVARTPVTADCVLAFVLTSAVVDRTLVTICASTDRNSHT